MNLESKSIKIFQLNVRGISCVNKFNQICASINAFNCKFDIIVFTEVKLKSSFPIQIYNMRGFKRFSSLRSDQGGGGVITFVKNSVQVENSFVLSATFEKLKLFLDFGFTKLRLIAYYRAPIPANMNAFIEDLEEELSTNNMKTCIMGDININSYTLAVTQAPATAIDRHYEELLKSFGYIVTNNLPTRPSSGRTIDHFISNFYNKAKINNFTVEIDPSLSDHSILITEINMKAQSACKENTFVKKNTDFTKLIEQFPDIKGEILQSRDPDEIANKITDAIQSSVSQVTTKKTYRLKNSNKINDWTSEKTILLILEKDKLRIKHRKKPTNENIRMALKTVSDELETSMKTDYAAHVRNQVSTRDPKKMWKNLNCILGRNSNKETTKSIESNGREIIEPREIADEFNSFFTTCASDLMSTQSSITNPEQYVELQPQQSMLLKAPDASEIANIIKQMKNKSAAGHDGIGPKVVKKLATKLIPLLLHLISVIFATGAYPKTFKKAVVTPVFKSGSKKSTDNYRPISVLPILNKIVEKVLHRRLLVYTNDHLKMIYSYQFGFRPKSGTENAAIELSNVIAGGIDKSKVVTGVFMDLKKAFDIVNHNLLLKVLEKYGVRGKVLQLFSSYLKDRTQVVKIGGVYSSSAPITAGVVQGSCLGPLLYLIFINAIGSLKLKGKLFLFADDAVLINIHEKSTEVISNIKNDMMPILDFFNSRQMILNSVKTNYIIFTSPHSRLQLANEIRLTDQLTIRRVTSCKYLGLIIDENMKWIEHILSLEKKLAPVNGILWKLRNILPSQSKKLVYDTLFQSHLSFMSTLWGLASCKALNNVQILQNRALRNTYELQNQANRVNMYTHQVEAHLPVRAICLLNTATYMYQIENKLTHSNIKLNNMDKEHNMNLRNSHNIRPEPVKTNYGAKSIASFGPKVYNKIPTDIKRSHHQHAFKWTLKCHLRNEKFITSCFDATFFDILI